MNKSGSSTKNILIGKTNKLKNPKSKRKVRMRNRIKRNKAKRRAKIPNQEEIMYLSMN